MNQDFQLFLLKAFIFMLCMEWHSSSCIAAPCYDYFTRESRPCFPQPVNAARGRNVTASNTCGMPSASYCEISPEKKCFICDANSSLNMHPAEYMVDEESPFASQPTWWQSDTWWDAIQSGLSKIAEPLHVNITLTFGKSYHISGKIRVTFYSERPQAMVIERSNDGGMTWKVYQYFAEDCISTYGISPSESPSPENPLEVTCSEEYSGQFPEKNGIVEFQAYARYPPEDYMAPHIQSYMLATHVRLRLEYPGTDGLELINSEVTLNRYYYAISDIRIDGRCNCHGHAEYCDGVGMNQYCFCEHNTMGRDCEYCRPLYNNHPWRPANTTHANECQKCDCNEHASSCTHDANIGSGVCIDCNHNTTGVQCHECADGFYKDIGKSLDDHHVCIPCDCFSVGITDNGYCNKDMSRTDIILGQCNCKENVFGRQCDECVPGYWGFRLPPGGHCQACSCNVLGTMNNSQTCDQQTGNCFCKPNIEGEKCNECKDGLYHFPTEQESDCLKCPCDVGGAYEICEKQTGQCNCRPNIEGQYCTQPKPGFFIPLFDYLLFEAEFQDENDDIHYEIDREPNHHTGQGFALLAPDTTIQFTNVQVKITWRYYLVIRYADNPQYSNTAFNLTLKSDDGLSTTIASSENRLQVDARTVITQEAFSLTANQLYNITVTLTSSTSGPVNGVLVDSLVLKPELTPTRIHEEVDTVATLSRCFINATYLSSTSAIDSSCSEVVFSFSAEMYDGALACDCDPKGSRESSQCSPIGGQCDCYTGVGGRRCSYCLPEYHGFGQGNCKVCECDSAGSESSVCDITSGVCQCKVNTEGDRCSRCKAGTFNLDARNEQGCQSCFGYGHGTQCISAQGFVAANITTVFTGSTLGAWLATPNSTGAMATAGTDGLVIRGNLTLMAPPKYLGLQLNSYKQKLLITIPTSVDLFAEEISLVLSGRSYNAELQPDVPVSDNHNAITFTLDENHLVTDNNDITAFQFQSLLSNISSFGLRVQSEMVIREIVLQSAVYDATNDVHDQISFVENMTCFENYTGFSCEACATGFTRESANAGPFSKCVLCSCNGRSSQCDPESGVCIGCDIGSTGDHCENCEFNVIGPYCNVCADGFYGLTQDHKNCKPCDCHLPGTQHGNTSSCNVTTGQCKCNQTLHTGGRRCNVCQENAWNRTESSLNCEECPPCFGMIKVEVDKFRQQILSLKVLLHSLLDMDILSQSFSFTERLQIIQDRVEEIVLRSEALATEEDSAKLQLERGFGVLEIFEKNRSQKTSEVNITVNAANRIRQKHRETVAIMENIHNLIAQGYNSLNNTMEGLLNEIRTSLMLLDDWMEELEQINAQSMEKVGEIGLINKTINNHLEAAVTLITKAREDAENALNLFDSLVLWIPTLQANMSDAKEIGRRAYDTARQQYNNASIVFNVTSHLETHMSNNTPSIAEEALWLKELAQEVRKNATDVIEAVQKASEEFSNVMNQTNDALNQITILQEQVRTSEQQAREHRAESQEYRTQAVTARHEAQEIQERARNILDTVENYGVVAEQAKQQSQKSIQDASELTAFHQSRIDYATNIAQSLHSSYNSSHSLVVLAEKVENHAREENEAISKTFVLSQKLRNYTADEKAATVVRNHNMVLDHIENQVTPIHEKCTSIQRDTQAILANTTTTQKAADELLEKVNGVSKELDKTTTSYDALPTLNTRPLAAMVSDISRIRGALQALKLSTSIQKLRQGKNEQQNWLDEYKPRVLKLRQQVAAMKSLIQSLKDIPCNN